MNRLCVLGALVAVLIALTGLPPHPVLHAQSVHERMSMFRQVARQTGVPLPILIGLAWEQSGLADHGGRPSIDHGYGLLDLSARRGHETLRAAAALLHRPARALIWNDRLNLLGGAMLLARYRGEGGAREVDRKPETSGAEGLGVWSGAIVRLAGIRSRFAADLLLDDLFARLRRGIDVEGVDLAAVPGARPRLALLRGLVPLARGKQTGTGADYPGAIWQPASAANYTVAHRPAVHHIRYIVIHDTESSCAAAVNWFANPAAQSSAHYVVCEDGTVIQTVREKDIAWHAGNWPINLESIGIEHEGYADGAYYTRAQYLASAALVRYLCKKYAITPGRNTIFGHENVPAATHTDPGPDWNWSFYMQRVRGDDLGYTTGSPAVLSVLAETLVYACPRTSCAVLGSANWGEQFADVGRRSEWEQIDYAGQTGWIQDGDVGTGSGRIVRTTAATTLRAGPSLKDDAIAVVPADQRYVSIVHDGAWWYVAFNHRYGFLPASALTVTDCLAGQLNGCVGAGLETVPNAASPGATLTIAGSGAQPNAPVPVTLAGQPLAVGTADTDGRFSVQAQVPAGLAAGSRSLAADLGAGKIATATLHVRAPVIYTPQVTLSASDLVPGQGVTVGGKGLPGLAAVALTVSLPLSSGTTKQMIVHTFTQPNGSVAPVHITVPLSAEAGTYTLQARAPGAVGQTSLTIAAEGVVSGTPTPTATIAVPGTETVLTTTPRSTPSPTPAG